MGKECVMNIRIAEEKDFNDVQIHNVLRFFNIQDFQSFLENQD